ncbi:hypothetical protein [Alkalihalobacterium bogoriense]|uniref:hypothetical protein n=1 Tax=Alkalihalobacterium bogoriense TaxID=246272 RepID=UPI00047ADFAA|nr:hypothetical protein [Alkalihalobacterium bogoriense]
MKKMGFSVFILMLLFITGCNEQQEIKAGADYKPMISTESEIYGDTGNVENELLNEWKELGEVKQQVSQTEPMILGAEYISNTLPVGTKIFADEQQKDFIYAEYNNKYIEYEALESNR